jgi:hypothetical protein
MMTVSRRRALAVIAGGAGLAALPGVAMAADPIPGVNVNLGQKPGGLTVSGVTGRNGDVVLTPRAAGTYEVYLPKPEQITRVCELVIHQPGREVVTTESFGPAPAKTTARGYVGAKKGGALAFIVQQPPRGQPFPAITVRLQTYDPPRKAPSRQ